MWLKAPHFPESEWVPSTPHPSPPQGGATDIGGEASDHTGSTDSPEGVTLGCPTGVTGCCRGRVRTLRPSRGAASPAWRLLKYVKGYIMLGTQ